MIVHDAAAAVLAVYTAAVVWVQVLAAAAAMVLCAIPLCIAPGVRAVRARRGGQAGAGAPPGRSCDSSAAEPPTKPAGGRVRPRRAPSWAHTDHHNDDYREAA